MTEWRVDRTWSINDERVVNSVSSQDQYDYDICGEETLSVVYPTFLTLTTDYASDPTNPYTTLFDDVSATEDDIMVHTFDFTVELNEYAGIVAPNT